MAPLKLFFGGSFDPVHTGHARLALACHRLTGAPVFFVPCASQPLKARALCPAEHRLAMLERVVAELNRSVGDETAFAVDTAELTQAGPSYTVLSLQRLRQCFPAERIAWLIGMDSLATLDQWHQWRSLTDWANLLVVNRPGWSPPASGELADWVASRRCDPSQLPQAGGVAFLDTTPLAIASRDLRRDLKAGHSIRYLVPDSVLAYIQTHGLYSSFDSFTDSIQTS